MRSSPKTFLACRAANAFADQLVIFAVPLLVFRMTGSVAGAGMAFAIEWLPRLVGLPLGGTLVDRLGGRTLYLISDAARVLLALAAWILTVQDLVSPAGLALLAGAIGFFHETAFVALEGSLPRVLPQAELPKAQSALGAIDHVGQLAGPAVAALLAAVAPLPTLLLGVAAAYAGSFVNAWISVPLSKESKSRETQVAAPSLIQDFLVALKLAVQTPALRAITGLTMLINLMFGVSFASSAGYVQQAFGAPEATFGWMNAVAGTLGVLAFVVIPGILKRGARVETLGLAAFAAACAAQIALASALALPAFIAGFAALVVADSVINIFIRTVRVRHIPEASLGAVLGVLVLANFSVFPVAGVAVATLVPVIGVRALMLLTVVLAVAGGAFAFPALARAPQGKI